MEKEKSEIRDLNIKELKTLKTLDQPMKWEVEPGIFI